MHERRFHGDAGVLRAPERVALLEVDRVVALSLEDAAIATVLEVGTGSGIFAEAFARLGLQVTGIDGSAVMVEAARRYVPTGRFMRAEAEMLPFPDDSFDLAFLGHVLHEADDPLAALAEARRVARLRVIVLEWPYAAEDHGPPLAHRLKPDVIVDLARRARFRRPERIVLEHMDLYRLRR
jgi:ubiquinone/menaquinone biosynthesis C-methylase UbiE